jgi:tetratricopeptide (TPR) repeat protein
MHPDEPLSSFQANLRRGEMLREQGRFAEAEKYLQEAITAEPRNSEGYYELAFCYCNWGGRNRRALQTVDHAISLDPNHTMFFALRAWILANLGRHTEAIKVARQALEINAYNILALNAMTRAHCELADWKKAEENARHTLSLDSRNEGAANMLSLSLRQQGRLRESDAVAADMLALDPDSSMAQGNAGWSALHAGDHRRANEHFLEALRLDPNDEDARRGLLHAFNSRAWIYRVYFQLIAWLGRHGRQTHVFLFLVAAAIYRVVVEGLRLRFGEEGTRWAVVVAALYVVILCLGRYFANLFLLFDPFARHVVTRKEMGWSVLAGLAYAAMLGYLLAVGAWPQSAVLLAILGCFTWGALAPRWHDASTPKPAAEPVE